jgi:hypothetical protein
VQGSVLVHETGIVYATPDKRERESRCDLNIAKNIKKVDASDPSQSVRAQKTKVV